MRINPRTRKFAWSAFVFALALPLAALADVETASSARAKLVELQARYGENHPRVIEQQRRVDEHARLATSHEPDVLKAERVDLAVMKQRYGENYPRYQEQLA